MPAGIVVGFSLIITDVDQAQAIYLTSGAMTVSLISIGMALAPEVIAQWKLRGLFEYRLSLPVPRLTMLAADTTIWMTMAIPALATALATAYLRFDYEIAISPSLIPAVILVSAVAGTIGYCIAYVAQPVLVGFIASIITIVALMFSPINYPSERLPSWAAEIHTWLPFQYMARIIRHSIAEAPSGHFTHPYLILASLLIAGLLFAAYVMTRRR